jgi:serine/threonine protein kinase
MFQVSTLYKILKLLNRALQLFLCTPVVPAMYTFSSMSTVICFCRDLKPHNLLLDRAWKVKLCDFGLAGSCKGGIGTPAYMAPELLTGDLFTDKVDVYSFGVVLNEMLCRRQPFFGLESQRISALVQRGDRPDMSPSIPEEIKKLIRECWDQNANCRPDFKRIRSQLLELQR